MRKLLRVFYSVSKLIGVSYPFKAFCFISLIFLSENSFAQTFPAPTSCTSGDLLLVSATMPPNAGDDACGTCTAGSTISRKLILSINNKTGSTRTSFAFWATLEIYNSDGTLFSSRAITRCKGPIPKNAITPVDFDTIQYPCGKSLRLTNLFLAWTTSNNNEVCPLNSATINPKCGTLPSVQIVAGLDATIVPVDATCTAGASIAVSPFGGIAPYRVTVNGVVRSNIAAGATANFTNLPPGTYSIDITDATTPTACSTSKSRTVGSTGSVSSPASGGNQTQCQQSPIQTLTATATVGAGETLTWYDAATGGNVVASPTKNTTGSVTYYAQASNGTCTSASRTAVTLTINAAPAAPASGGNQTECQQSPIQTLTATATGGTITWYDASSGGNIVPNPTKNTTGSVTYYAQASNGTCSSLTRTAVTLTINAAPAAPVSGGNQTECQQSPIQTLTATATAGGTITWYDAATGGNVIANPTKNTTGSVTYYAQASNGTCSSLTRTGVTLTINAAPAAPASGGNQTECQQSPIQTLTATATGGTITWYDAATGGNVVANPTKNTTGSVTYYAQASNGTCSSLTRTGVTLTINATPATASICITEPKLCGPATGSISINNPVTGYTYTLGATNIVAQINTPVIFNNLSAGSNPGITVTNGGCTSTATNCSTVSNCGSSRISNSAVESNKATKSQVTTQEPISLKFPINTDNISNKETSVKAYPNPFSDKVKFEVTSALSGNGSLEIVNMMGQKIRTVYQGFISAGIQTFELSLPVSQISHLAYVLRIGNKKMTGKLLQINQ